MKLTEQLELLRGKMHDEHAEALRLLDYVDKRLFENDGDVMRRIEDILAADYKRKSDIVMALQTLADRIGHVPRVVPLTAAVPRADALGQPARARDASRAALPPGPSADAMLSVAEAESLKDFAAWADTQHQAGVH